MAYTGRIRPKEVLFSGVSGIWKGKDFTSWSIWKERIIRHFGLKKAQQG